MMEEGKENGEVMGKWECKWGGQLEQVGWRQERKRKKEEGPLPWALVWAIALGFSLGQ